LIKSACMPCPSPAHA